MGGAGKFESTGNLKFNSFELFHKNFFLACWNIVELNLKVFFKLSLNQLSLIEHTQFNIFHSIQLKRKISQFQTHMKRKAQNIERMKSNYFRIKTHDKRDFPPYFLFSVTER
jgi:hypothetical protein